MTNATLYMYLLEEQQEEEESLAQAHVKCLIICGSVYFAIHGHSIKRI